MKKLLQPRYYSFVANFLFSVYAFCLIIYGTLLFSPVDKTLTVDGSVATLGKIVVFIFLAYALYFLMPIRNRIGKYVLSGIVTVIVSIDGLLTYFFLTRRYRFDFYYFWSNRHESLPTLSTLYTNMYLRIAIVVVLLIVVVWIIKKAHDVFKHKRLSWRTWIILCAIAMVYLFAIPVTPLRILAGDIKAISNVYKFTSYHEWFNKSLAYEFEADTTSVEAQQSIIFLQLESINGEFVGEDTTPNLYSLVSDGILLKKHHSNSVQTKRTQEVIICSTLPTLAYQDSMSYIDTNQDVICLPNILNQLGYTTLYFQNYDLEFQGIKSLMERAGFDKLIGPEIMQEGDPKQDWGYREDAFFQRVKEYLETNHKNEKLFVYIVTGATNHAPFQVSPENIREDIYNSLPVFDQDNYINRRLQLLYTQDVYVSEFINMIDTVESVKNADLYVFGDHPMGINLVNHEYSYNIDNVEQETFYTAFGYRSGAVEMDNKPPKIVLEDISTSHQGIAPTVLESLGVASPFPFSRSFYTSLSTGVASESTCIVDVQPYIDPAIALVQYPHKYVIRLKSGDIAYTDIRTNKKGEYENYTIIESSLEKTDVYMNACIENIIGPIPPT